MGKREFLLADWRARPPAKPVAPSPAHRPTYGPPHWRARKATSLCPLDHGQCLGVELLGQDDLIQLLGPRSSLEERAPTSSARAIGVRAGANVAERAPASITASRTAWGPSAYAASTIRAADSARLCIQTPYARRWSNARGNWTQVSTATSCTAAFTSGEPYVDDREISSCLEPAVAELRGGGQSLS